MGANSTGTPTSLGIPTLNPAQDILKSDGVNEIVTSIDGKIAARMFAPSSPSDKQVVKWSLAGGTWIADFVAPSELKQEGATNNQALLWNTGSGKWVPTTITPSQSMATPSNPTGVISATATMCGLAASITPAYTGRVLIVVTGCAGSPGAGNIQLRTGTGTAPTLGAALTGTQRGANQAQVLAGGKTTGFACAAIVTGLTLATAVWIDLAQNGDGTNTLTLSSITTNVIEF